jgi:hypothetical protein
VIETQYGCLTVNEVFLIVQTKGKKKMKKTFIKFVAPFALVALAGAYVWGGADTQPHAVEASMANAATATPKAKVIKTATPLAKATVAPKVMATVAISSTKGLYKDKQGRPFGGNAPYINYTPSMVTGKPCPRVTKWTLITKEQPSDPCVIQNAIDDYMVGAFALNTINSVDEIKAIAEEFKTNKDLENAFSLGWGSIYLDGAMSRACDQPMVQLLINPEKTTRAIDYNGVPTVYLLTTQTSVGMKPYSCKLISVNDGAINQRPPYTAKDLAGTKAGIATRVEMFYVEQTHRWVINGADRDATNPFIDGKTLKQVYEASPYKP